MAEAMIALLKKKSYAGPSDVEMYLKSYSSLIYEMQIIDPATISNEALDEISKKLDKLTLGFTYSDSEVYKANREYIYMY
jgi:hypothetical protein